MIKNNNKVYVIFTAEDVFMIIGIGNNRVISTSKIKKITAIRKNRRENGIRAVSNGLNPHSNGEDFSRSLLVFILIIVARDIIICAKIIIIVRKVMVSIIIFLVRSYWVEVNCTLYTKNISSSSVDW